MKNYKLLKEHDSHFDLEHDKQGTFVVAKYGLDDATIKKIRSLGGTAHYAEGTEDAKGVKPEDAGKATDYLLTPQIYRQVNPLEIYGQVPQVPLSPQADLTTFNEEPVVTAPPPENDVELARQMKARDDAQSNENIARTIADTFTESDLPTKEKPVTEETRKEYNRRIKKTLPPGGGRKDQGDILEKSPALLSGEYEEKPRSLVKQPQTPAAPKNVLKEADPNNVWDKIKGELSEFLDDKVLKNEFVNEQLKKLDIEGQGQLTPAEKVVQNLGDMKDKILNYFDDKLKSYQEYIADYEMPGTNKDRLLSAGEAARYGVLPGQPAPDLRTVYGLSAPKSIGVAEAAPATPPAPPEKAQVGPPAEPRYLQQTRAGLSAGAQKPEQTRAMGTGTAYDPFTATNDAYDRLKQLNLEKAGIEQKNELAAAESQLGAIKNLQNLETTFKTQLDAINNEQKKLQDDVASQKIDPFRIYSRMSTGNRVLAAVSLLLGGISQGISGADTNPAWEVIQDSLDRDIDAQKTELGRKQNLLSFNLERYKRLDAAVAATRSQMLSIVQMQINMAASKANSNIAMKNAEIANAKIDIERGKLNESLATQSAVRGILNTQEGIGPDFVMQLPTEIRELLVRVPNGRFYPAKDKEGATKATEGLGQTYTVDKLLTRGTQIFNDGRLANPKSDVAGEAKALNTQLLFEVKELAKLGVLSEGDKETIDEMMPDFTAYTFRDVEKGKIRAFRQYLDTKINKFLYQYIPNYSPGSIIVEEVR